MNRSLKKGRITYSMPAFLCFGLINLFSQASAEVLVVMHKSAPIDQLSSDEIKMIYLGKSKNLAENTVAHIVDHLVSSPLREEFYQKATNKTTAKSVRIWARYMFSGKGTPPEVAKDDKEVLDIINQYPTSGIGYIERENISDQVKIVHVVQ